MSSLQHHTDEELFSLISTEGGLPAFALLYQRFSVRLFNYCLQVLSNKDDADDAFQECWVKVHDRAKAGDTRVQNVRSYLFRAAHNACLMHVRKNRRSTISIEDIELTHLQVEPFKQLELTELIQLGISTLEPSAREAFVLHEVEGFSYTDMADLTGESVHALRNKVWRARNQIRMILIPYIGDSR